MWETMAQSQLLWLLWQQTAIWLDRFPETGGEAGLTLDTGALFGAWEEV